MAWGWRIISSSLRLKEVAVPFVKRLRQKSAEILQLIMTTTVVEYAVFCVLIAIVVLLGVTALDLILHQS